MLCWQNGADFSPEFLYDNLNGDEVVTNHELA